MPRESQERRESTAPMPLIQAAMMIDVALRQLQALKSDIDNNVEAISDLKGFMKNSANHGELGRSPAGIKVAIDRSRTALERLQSVEVGPRMDESARQVAKGLAILYAVSSAAMPKREAKPAPEPRAVPKHIVERRTAPRAQVEAEIGFQSDTNFYTGFTEDISTGGIFLSTFDLKAIGSVINVNFTLPGGHFISVDGVVRWLREYNELNPDMSPGMGIQFENLAPNDKDAIEAFIKQRSTLFYDGE